MSRLPSTIWAPKGEQGPEGPPGPKGPLGPRGPEGPDTPRWCGNFPYFPTTRLDGTPLKLSDECGNTLTTLRYSWNGTAWIALNGSVQELETELANPAIGPFLLGYKRLNTISNPAVTVGEMLNTVAVSPWEFSALITNKPTANDPATWDWKPAFEAMFIFLRTSTVRAIALSGSFRIVGGFSPASNILSNLTVYSEGASIVLDAPTGDNVVFQVGSNFTLVGHLTGSVINGTGNGNGFVRNIMCIGNWFNSTEVYNVNIESLKLTGLADGTAIAIAGNTYGVSIGRLELGGGQLGLMMHWTGIPNNINPTETYHPHDINIGTVIGGNYTEAMVTESACYNVTIDLLSGTNNYRDFNHIGGDFGETRAVSRDKGKVCKGNSIGRLLSKDSKWRGVDYNASAGLVSGIMEGEFNLDSVLVKGTLVANSVGIRIENRAAGRIGTADVSSFSANILFINCTGGSDGELQSSNAMASGITYSNCNGTKASILVSTEDNQAAAGGVPGVSINATCVGVELDQIKIANTNTASHGCVLSPGSSSTKIGSVSGSVTSSRFLLVDNSVGNANKVGPCLLANGSASYSGPDPTVSATARGHSISWGSADPTSGTFRRGDITFAASAAPNGKAGRICTTGGVAGSTAVFKMFGVIDA